MSNIDEVMEILKNGKRHNLSEIAKRLALRPEKIGEILQFLAECDFATFDQKTNTAIIDPELKELLVPKEQPTATVIDRKKIAKPNQLREKKEPP